MSEAAVSGTPHFSYDAHARTCDPEDFLGQTKRTVHGVPLGEDQIGMIITQIRNLLELGRDDRLAEIACGNGFLSARLFADVRGYHGSDISEYLIGVARKHFQRDPDFTFSQQDGLGHIRNEPRPQEYTKLLCYASAQYFSDDDLLALLRSVRQRFPRLSRVLLGNCPDRRKLEQFFHGKAPPAAELDDTGTALGRWRTPESLCAIAKVAGWDTTIAAMPPQFSGANYRFDALLTAQSTDGRMA